MSRSKSAHDTLWNLLLRREIVALRQDRLRRSADGLRIAERRIVLGWNIVTGPSLSLFF